MAKSMKEYVKMLLDLNKNASNYTPQEIEDKMSKIQETLTMKKGGWLQKARSSMEKKGTVGSFTEYCGGKVTSECIERGLKSKDPKVRKRAAFAKAVRSFKKQYGGVISNEQRDREHLSQIIYMAMGGEFENEGLSADDMSQMSIDEARDIYHAVNESDEEMPYGGGEGEEPEPEPEGVKRFFYKSIKDKNGKSYVFAYVLDKKNRLFELSGTKVGKEDLTRIPEKDIEPTLMKAIKDGQIAVKYQSLVKGNVEKYMKHIEDSLEKAIKSTPKKAEGGEQQSQGQQRQEGKPELSYEEFVNLAMMYPEYVQRLFSDIQQSQQQSQEQQEHEQQESPEYEAQEEVRRFGETPEQQSPPVGEYLYGGKIRESYRWKI